MAAHTNPRYTDLVSNRVRVDAGEYLGTIAGRRVRFMNCKARNPNSTRAFAPFVNNWSVYCANTGKLLTEGWQSRVAAAQVVARGIELGRI